MHLNDDELKQLKRNYQRGLISRGEYDMMRYPVAEAFRLWLYLTQDGETLHLEARVENNATEPLDFELGWNTARQGRILPDILLFTALSGEPAPVESELFIGRTKSPAPQDLIEAGSYRSYRLDAQLAPNQVIFSRCTYSVQSGTIYHIQVRYVGLESNVIEWIAP